MHGRQFVKVGEMLVMRKDEAAIKALLSDRHHHLRRFDSLFMASSMGAHLDAATDGRMTNDAASGYALARELEFVSQIVAQEPLTDLTASDLLPMAVDQPQPFQETYTWKQQTWTRGSRSSRSYKDLGTRGDIQIAKNSQGLSPIINHASWGIDDIARAALGGIPLPALELQGALRATAETINDEVFFGNSAEGIDGVYDNSAIVNTQVAVGGAGTRPWETKTADEMEADIITMINEAVEACNGKGDLMPNRLALPTVSRMRLATTPRSQLSTQTVLQFAEMALAAAGAPNPKIVAHPELSSNKAGQRWAMIYRHDPRVAGRILPVPPAFLPPDIENTQIVQAVHAQHGGMNCRYPVAMRIYRGL